jgi:YbbR domain-containing protein
MTLPGIIVRNFWLKFFSIAMATLIWLTIHYGIRNEFSISQLNINNLLAQEYVRVPVAVVTPPGDTRVFRINPNEVVVIAVGEQTVLRKAAQKNIRVYVDLTGFHARQSLAEELHADVPPDINVLEISPATVSVEQVTR